MSSSRNQLQDVIISLLKEGQLVEVPVFGISMYPFLLPGAVVRVRKCDWEILKKGDIIFFESPPKIILHRIVQIGDGWVQCKGDSLLKNDSVITRNQFIGRVEAYQRQTKFRSVNSIGFRLYARMMVFCQRFTGFLFFPQAVVWQKINRQEGEERYSL